MMKRRWFMLGFSIVLGMAAVLVLGWLPGNAQMGGEPGTWRTLGPEGGGANALALSPGFATDGVVFGGNAFYIRQTKTGLGLFKSTDGGRAWTLSTTTNDTGTQITGVDALALSPNFGADRTVFAGTNTWLFKSTDAGATWVQVEGVGGLLYGVSAVAVAPDYAASGHVMATSGNTLYVSENGGLTWTTQSKLGWGGALAYSPEFADDQTAFVGGDGLWQTSDGGLSWSQVLSESAWTIALSPDFANDGTLFSGGLDGPVYVSRDAGTTWISHTVSITAGTVNALVVSPAYLTDTTIFLGSHAGLHRSTDGGMTWAPVSSYSGPQVDALAISPDWPTDPTLLVGTPAGVYRTDDGGATWTRHGFTPLEVNMLTGAQDGQRLFAGTVYHGLFQTADAGEHWAPAHDLYNKTLVDVVAVPGYPTTPRLFASASAGGGMGLYRSDDGGYKWVNLNSADYPGGYWAFSPDYAQDGNVFVTSRGEVLSSTYHGWGGNWEPVGTWPDGVSGAARHVLLSPDYPADATLWAAGSGFWRLDPGATRWVSATLPVPNAEISDIAQSPDFLWDQTLLATGSGREAGEIPRHYTVYRSVDAGATWTTATLALYDDTIPLIALAFSPRFAVDQTAYAVSHDQLFRSTDGGEHWVAVGIPPDVGMLHDVVAHGYGRVSVATDNGIWQYTTDWEETIVNGGFEADGGWSFPDTPLPAGTTDVVTHTGTRAARIGVGAGSATPTEIAYSSVQQTLNIPDDTLTATLHFYYYPQTDETTAAQLTAATTTPAGPGDLQYAMLVWPNQFEWLFHELLDADRWLSRTLDLSLYAGQTITLQFGVKNDGMNGHTGMYLDDVSLLTRRLRLADLTERIYLPLVLRAYP
jgi:hypothetical protein